MVFKNWADLEKAMGQEIGLAVQETTLNAHAELIRNLERFYQTPDPKRYKRLDHLKNSSNSDFSARPYGGNGIVYLDDSVPYPTGTYDTNKVFNEAEIHGSGIIGNPHFWSDTMDKVETDIMPTAFRNHGFK